MSVVSRSFLSETGVCTKSADSVPSKVPMVTLDNAAASIGLHASPLGGGGYLLWLQV